MTWETILGLWSHSMALSVSIWVVILLVALYLARRPAHEFIRTLSHVLYNALRKSAHSVRLAETRLGRRNREVLLAMAAENQERIIEREFHRINAVVSRDLSSYPALHRQLSEQITHIDEDYRETAETPPEPPAWLDAVEAVAKIPTDGDPTIARILQDIHHTLKRSTQDITREYRIASGERHKLLKRMLPYWRRLDERIREVQKTIKGIGERATEIDKQMTHYEEILSGNDRVVRTLSSSSMTQFLISGVVMVIAIMGGMINFQLIALPMSEMVGGASYIGSVRTADVAALVIIMVEIAMGLFLMESLRITRLFPVIGALDDRMRRRMIWVTFFILLAMASIESALAYMRDMLAADHEALTQSLAASSGTVVQQAQFRWIPSIGQMVMGFVLPFALTFVAIPLESFIHASRTVMGVVMAGLLRGLAYVLHLLAGVMRTLGNSLTHLYDLIIFLPLAVEHLVSEWRSSKSSSETKGSESPQTKAAAKPAEKAA
jgi:hypothetical protein